MACRGGGKDTDREKIQGRGKDRDIERKQTGRQTEKQGVFLMLATGEDRCTGKGGETDREKTKKERERQLHRKKTNT